ncbi:hypothetical protein J3E72DRAFT_35105 [Bipolaris maydis]|nr:hypothetical protein J3E74DRAFT_31110 [Bipolaris maydis]KAJ6199993.1 hypothetical protein J3E72DRAFT_35105 [Bipolaris maydis]
MSISPYIVAWTAFAPLGAYIFAREVLMARGVIDDGRVRRVVTILNSGFEGKLNTLLARYILGNAGSFPATIVYLAQTLDTFWWS